jgi:hypothetical protein
MDCVVNLTVSVCVERLLLTTLRKLFRLAFLGLLAINEALGASCCCREHLRDSVHWIRRKAYLEPQTGRV